LENSHLLAHTSYRLMALLPSVFLVVFSMCLGYFIFSNIEYMIISSKRTSGLYWTYLVLRIGLVTLSLKITPYFWGGWFIMQVKLVKTFFLSSMIRLKRLSQLFSSTFLERGYLLYRLPHSGALYVQLVRIGYILTWISLILLLL
jgi:hypothetical protein